jgi:hypothetical protein
MPEITSRSSGRAASISWPAFSAPVDSQPFGGVFWEAEPQFDPAKWVGAPERSRTPNPQIRSLVLYPVELRARTEQQAGCAGSHNYSSRMQQGKADHRGGRWPVAPGKTT